MYAPCISRIEKNSGPTHPKFIKLFGSTISGNLKRFRVRGCGKIAPVRAGLGLGMQNWSGKVR